MYVDKISFIIYMITTSLCIIALCIFLIKYIKKTIKLETESRFNRALSIAIVERVEKLENDKGRKRNNN